MAPSTNGHVALMQSFELVEDTLNSYLITGNKFLDFLMAINNANLQRRIFQVACV